MKKRRLIVAVCTLLLITLMGTLLVGCTPSKEKMIKMLEKFNEEKSGKINMTITVMTPNAPAQSVDYKMKFDHDIIWQAAIPNIDYEKYVRSIGNNKVEVYTNKNGLWYRSVQSMDPQQLGFDMSEFDLDEQFDKEDDHLVLKEKYTDDYNVDKMTIKAEKDRVIVKGKVTNNNVSVSIEEEMYGFGEVSLKLPTNYIDEE